MGQHMAAAFLRLLALVALVLMPFGMASTSALAAPADNGHVMAMGHEMAEMDKSHCADRQDQNGDDSPISKSMNCMAACAAIPGPGAPPLADPIKPAELRNIFLATRFVAVDPEIATPPPKRA